MVYINNANTHNKLCSLHNLDGKAKVASNIEYYKNKYTLTKPGESC